MQPPIDIQTDTIKCPECGLIQKADVTYSEGEPFYTYVKKCEGCNYVIGESEWNKVNG